MRESRTYGSVRAKAEWLSYSTTLVDGELILKGHRYPFKTLIGESFLDRDDL